MSNSPVRRLTAALLVLALVVSCIFVFTTGMSEVWGSPSTLYEYYNTNDDVGIQTCGVSWRAQTFTVGATAHSVTSVKIKAYRVGADPGTVTLSIRATDGSGHPTGNDLTSGTIAGSTITDVSPGAWYEISVTEFSLVASTKYAVVVRAPSGYDGNDIRWRADGSAPTYGDGNSEWSSNSGSTWVTRTDYDHMFEVWGNPSSGFSISATPTSQTVIAGNTASSTLNLVAIGGFSGTVSLSVTSGAPPGATCTITPNSISTFPGTATLSVPTLSAGVYPVVVTGTSGLITKTVTFTVTVTPLIGPGWSMTAITTSQSIGAGGSASYTLSLTATSQPPYTGTVSLSVTSGLPSGATPTITPNPVSLTPGATVTPTLSISTLITTPSGTSSIVVTATDGTITQTVTVSLTVTITSYSFNVKAGATQIVVTLTYSWSGSGSPPLGSITIAGPSGTPTLSESGAVVYDRTSITVSGSTSTYSIIHRAIFTITAPGSAQTWTAYISLSGVSSYNVAIEVS